MWQSIRHGQDDRFRRRRKARLVAVLIPPTRPADDRAPPPPAPAPPTAGRVGNLALWTRTIEPNRRDRDTRPRGDGGRRDQQPGRRKPSRRRVVASPTDRAPDVGLRQFRDALQ